MEIFIPYVFYARTCSEVSCLSSGVCVGFFFPTFLLPSPPFSLLPCFLLSGMVLQAELQQARGKQECWAVLGAGHQGVCRGLERSLHCFVVVLHKDENV